MHDGDRETAIVLRQRVEELEQLRDRHATDMAVMFQENAALKRELEAFDLVRVASRLTVVCWLRCVSLLTCPLTVGAACARLCSPCRRNSSRKSRT